MFILIEDRRKARELAVFWLHFERSPTIHFGPKIRALRSMN